MMTSQRRWLGAAIALFVPLMVLRGLGQAGRFGDGPLSHWYVQTALAVAGALLLLAVEWLVGRAYRRREQDDRSRPTPADR